jgi:hypothetical protein
MIGRPVLSLTASVAIAIASATVPARADPTKRQCIDANSRAQDLRRSNRLADAREPLLSGADAACPAIVRDDCARRLDELEKAQPTIAFEVKDASGADVGGVAVAMDGRPLAERLGGSALPVDMGEHAFTFTVPGQPPVTRTLMVTEGEKGRRERIVLGPPSAPAPEAAPSLPAYASAPEQPAPHALGKERIWGLVVGGVGVAGLVVGGIFGITAFSQKGKEQDDCPSTGCSPTAHDRAVADRSTGLTDSTIATVGVVAGAVLLAGGVVLFVTGHHAPAAGMALVPNVGPGGGGMSLRGSF